MTALQLLKDEIKNARELFESTVADVDSLDLSQEPGGKALPLGAIYAHLLFSEDAILLGMVQKKTPLSESTFKDKTGVSSPMPAWDEKWNEENEKWAKSIEIDLVKLREYSKAVYAATDEYVNSLNDEDMETDVDLGPWGKKKVYDVLFNFIIGHTCSMAGEISVLKGLQGAKGYPF